jgi:mRNA interferase MazF
MAGILRGEIRWADLNPVRGHEQAGLRPARKSTKDFLKLFKGNRKVPSSASNPLPYFSKSFPAIAGICSK